jgi:hypothetical protein
MGSVDMNEEQLAFTAASPSEFVVSSSLDRTLALGERAAVGGRFDVSLLMRVPPGR